jgi:hypothetical protein
MYRVLSTNSHLHYTPFAHPSSPFSGFRYAVFQYILLVNFVLLPSSVLSFPLLFLLIPPPPRDICL